MQTIEANNTCVPIYNRFENNEYCNGKEADFSASDAEKWGDSLVNVIIRTIVTDRICRASVVTW